MSKRGWIVAVVGILLLGGHVVYWYLPAERPRPLDDGPAALFYSTAGDPVRLWLPSPHQNLAVLDEWLGGLESYLTDVAALSGEEPLQLPSFGPFRLPPSRALAVGYDPPSGSLSLVAEVYPAMAFLGRAAGALTGNRWLREGEVASNNETYRIHWQGSTWHFSRSGRSASAGQPVAVTSGSHGPEGLFAALTLAEPRSGLPIGSYALRRQGSPAAAWVLATELDGAEPGGAPGFWDHTPTTDLPPVFIASGRPHAGRGAGALVLFGAELDAGTLKLPGAAAFSRQESNGWQLPGESTLSKLRWSPRRGKVRGWSVQALDRTSLQAAREQTEILETLQRAVETQSQLVARVDLTAALAHVRALASAISKVPVIGRRQARSWEGIERLLEPFEGFALLEVELTGDRAVARLLPREATPVAVVGSAS